MGKITKYLLFLTFVILLFHFSGALAETTTPTSYLIDKAGILNPESVKDSEFYDKMDKVLIAAALGTIALIILKINPMYILTIPIVYLLVAIAWDLIIIFRLLSETSYPLAALIISPLIIVFILAIFDWWRSMGET